MPCVRSWVDSNRRESERARLHYNLRVQDSPRTGRSDDRTEMLLVAAQQQRPGAIDELIGEHLDDLRAFVRLQSDARLRLRESGSDLVQSICREVLEDLPKFEFRGAGSFRAWLFTAALNKVRQKGEFHRAQRRDPGREVRAGQGRTSVGIYVSLCSFEPSPSQNAIADEEAQRIEAAMDGLPEAQREALLLARIVGLSQAEIAERMGRTVDSVRNLVSRASLALLARLEGRE